MRESNQHTKDTNDSLKNGTTSTKFGPITVHGYKFFYTVDSVLAQFRCSEWRLLHHENEPVCSSDKVAYDSLMACSSEGPGYRSGSRWFKANVVVIQLRCIG